MKNKVFTLIQRINLSEVFIVFSVVKKQNSYGTVRDTREIRRK